MKRWGEGTDFCFFCVNCF